MDVGNLISCSSNFSKSNVNIWQFLVHILLKPLLDNFEHYFTSIWDECSCSVVWKLFGIAFLWDWNWKLTFSNPVTTAEFSKFAGILSAALLQQHLFRIWNSSSGIPSAPLAWFSVVITKGHLISHSRMSNSRWVITPSWLSESLDFFGIFILCILTTSS